MDLMEMLALAGPEELAEMEKALAHERAMRAAMADTGESRETIQDVVDAMDSMQQEAVLELTDGDPTTLHDALSRYVKGLDTDAPFPLSLIDDLYALLNYPWSGPALEMTDDGHVMQISVGGSVLLTVDREDNTLSSVSNAVEAVHRAMSLPGC